MLIIKRFPAPKRLNNLFRFVTCVGILTATEAKAQSGISFDPHKKIVAKTYFADPAISPDGSTIAFSSGGDIWTVPAAGGEARLLISNPAFETRPIYSPDGKYLAFKSNRTGNGDIYVMDLKTSELKRLTFDDGNEDLNSWSPDSKYVYFSTGSHDINAMQDVYRVKAEGGTPMPVTNSRFMTEFFAQPSPNGKEIVFDARGVASSQWWRNGHSHLDESQLWLLKEGSKDGYEQLTEGGAKDLWPMFGKDGETIYFVSDRSGVENLWSMPVHGKGKQLTQFTKGRVLWPTITKNGQTIVFEKDFNIWKYDVASGKASMVEIQRMGVPSGSTAEANRTEQYRDMELSPDGKKLAFVSHGEVFVSAASGGDAFRATFTGANESQLNWAPNSNMLCYVSDRDILSHIYEYNFVTNKETRLTNGDQDESAPIFSPDGKTLAFVRDNKELRVLDIASNKETLLAKAFMGRFAQGSTSIKWSPDGKWIAFGCNGVKGFRNISVVPATGGDAKPVSFLANTSASNVFWGEDGKYIVFTTAQRTETGNIARVELTQKRPEFNEDKFQRLFIDQSTSPTAPINPSEPSFNKPAPKADTSSVTAASNGRGGMGGRRGGGTTETKINFDGIRDRLTLLNLGDRVDVNDITMSKDGQLLVSASIGGQTNLYLYSANEGGRGEGGGGRGGGAGSPLRQLTTTPGNKSEAQFSPDGKEVFYLSQGAVNAISLDTKMVKPISMRAEMTPEFDKEKVEVFRQAWQSQKRAYADPNMNGVNWDSVYQVYEPLAAGAATSDELRRILSLMVGELNSSHSGVGGGGTAVPAATGRLGLVFDRAEYEDKGKFKVTEVIAGSPAELVNVRVGAYLSAIDGKPLTADDNIDQWLENKVGHKVLLTFKGTDSSRNIAVKPVNLATEKGLLYKQWVKQQRDYVAKLSNGRLGYVHMIDMGQPSLDQLYLDLDAENQAREGVVVDVRNNNGGFVNAYALDVLSRKAYLTMIPRGQQAGPARAALGQRALELPTILLTNQHSLSDAEDFTEGYRAMGLGKVVGEPTGGWIIFTGSVNLIDGSTVRMPSSVILDHEGKNMELNPRKVDIAVSNPIGQPYNKDAQTEAAVKELLKEIDAKK